MVTIHLPFQETQETRVQFLGQEDPLKEEKVTHSSILAWKIPWTEEPDGLQSMGSQRVRHYRAHTHTSFFFFFHINKLTCYNTATILEKYEMPV